jgi:hypothetical protein
VRLSSSIPPLVLLLCAACETQTERVPIGSDRAQLPYVAPPPPRPAPQVMIGAPADAPPQHVNLGTMTEAQRRAILLPTAVSIEPYVPAPFHAPASHATSYATNHESEGSHRSAVPDYYDETDYQESPPTASSTAMGLLRLATYTAAGAIIGNQWGEKGKGAAIGGGLALLTWPFFGGRYGW